MKIKFNKIKWYSWIVIIFFTIVMILPFTINCIRDSRNADTNISNQASQTQGQGMTDVVVQNNSAKKPIPCQNTTSLDGAKNPYKSITCGFSQIHNGDSFIADIGHNEQAIFTFVGSSSVDDALPTESSDFDSDQKNDWSYQIVGHEIKSPKTLSINIENCEHKIVGFTLADLNFDGYFDIVDSEQCGAGASTWQEIFWFNPTSQEYIVPEYFGDNMVLNQLTNDPRIDLKNKTWQFGGTDGADSSFDGNYTFVNGKWTLQLYEESRPSDDGKYCVTKGKKLKGSKYVDVGSSTPRESDEHC